MLNALFPVGPPRLAPETIRRLQLMLEDVDLTEVTCKLTVSCTRQPTGGRPEKYTATVELPGAFVGALLTPPELLTMIRSRPDTGPPADD